MVAVVQLHLNYTLKQTLILLSVFVVKGAKRVFFFTRLVDYMQK